MPDPRFIVCVNSRKGGVGKTTLALAMAAEVLRAESNPNADPPAVLIDADLFGTELTDALLPFDDFRTPKQWDLGLADILVQSTGGDQTVRDHLRQCLENVKSNGSGLPLIPLFDNSPKLLVIPSLRWRVPQQRRTALSGLDNRNDPMGTAPSSRLDLALIAESFGRFQLEMRLTALVDAVISTFSPKIIVIDHAPFHLPLSHTSRKWQDPKDLAGLLSCDRDVPEWQPYWVRRVEIVGPEQQALEALLPDILDTTARTKAHQAGQRWVLNRDVHLPAGSGIEKCNTYKLFPRYRGPLETIGHVTVSPNLFAGAHNRNVVGIVGGELEAIRSALSYTELFSLALAQGDLKVNILKNDTNTPGHKAFDPVEWKEFLR
ncbi:MAG: hypothetical protein QNJ97_06985 [Myxococcota bacterium]|nr:hypothetical protein [Myxococcota bacterium]